jgi:hypothetical protein
MRWVNSIPSNLGQVKQPRERTNELHSQTSEAIPKSAPNFLQALAGSTQLKPPSLRRKLSRTTGRRSNLKAQLALIADASRACLGYSCSSGAAERKLASSSCLLFRHVSSLRFAQFRFPGFGMRLFYARSSARVCNKRRMWLREIIPSKWPFRTTGNWFKSSRPITSSALVTSV